MKTRTSLTMFFASLISNTDQTGLVTEGRRVCTLQACYLGGQLDTAAGGAYFSFQGIRYAEPPTGQLRLRRPVPREEAGGETEVDVSGTSSVVCPQWSPDLSRLTGQEDCLLLNVYVPGNITLEVL